MGHESDPFIYFGSSGHRDKKVDPSLVVYCSTFKIEILKVQVETFRKVQIKTFRMVKI